MSLCACRLIAAAVAESETSAATTIDCCASFNHVRPRRHPRPQGFVAGKTGVSQPIDLQYAASTNALLEVASYQLYTTPSTGVRAIAIVLPAVSLR
jgi:hypothetical protein